VCVYVQALVVRAPELVLPVWFFEIGLGGWLSRVSMALGEQGNNREGV
jgi:hypothetical protein